ncbi:tRNA (adenosine(37)-N6)-threonylcarbamoyltransferase complex dimerization subunit type 1 TsaB [Brevibacterium sp. ZH18]|uniref:tRNA (adenosine(37)-N6)-threonylcarbamoyltransferase complex dimerization subunit type 1 TsaB n=1 Tax=Brevibacterium sp. ZH18 TaxID=2927784 RepID=UPI001F601A21|nr:tRNA (adenosine(37)-N6)-threonylcarbamoyltransferase complex dimerization subunit type 1 TsaB [Brevibacterium sp. ZH18]MCI4011094.1 tRNA (adenosine(37)-N6)-threonylcarbamoyltransferase complex dimerization subunit type 1 TsaB [Brevibacterium sp. ZH18]
MIILSIDTSQSASVALVDTESDTVLAAEHADDQRRHVEFIGPALARVLADPVEPELVVTGIGPGPFTGLRVGIAAGIAVGQARGIPVKGLLSQAALAEELQRTNTQTVGPVLIAADARRREVYFSVYEASDASLAAGPFVAKPAEVDTVLAAAGQTEIAGRLGRGFVLYPDVLGKSSFPTIVDPRAEYLAFAASREIVAGRELAEPVPEYLRDPDAKATPVRASTLK